MNSNLRSFISFSPPAGSGIQFNQSNVSDYVMDQWSRSIVIDHVTDRYVDMLEMFLEDASEGGGKVLTFQRQGRTVLATFEDSNGDFFCSYIYI